MRNSLNVNQYSNTENMIDNSPMGSQVYCRTLELKKTKFKQLPNEYGKNYKKVRASDRGILYLFILSSRQFSNSYPQKWILWDATVKNNMHAYYYRRIRNIVT